MGLKRLHARYKRFWVVTCMSRIIQWGTRYIVCQSAVFPFSLVKALISRKFDEKLKSLASIPKFNQNHTFWICRGVLISNR